MSDIKVKYSPRFELINILMLINSDYLLEREIDPGKTRIHFHILFNFYPAPDMMRRMSSEDALTSSEDASSLPEDASSLPKDASSSPEDASSSPEDAPPSAGWRPVAAGQNRATVHCKTIMRI
jgi:hypothetical protein